jgi:hypothetical protein
VLELTALVAYLGRQIGRVLSAVFSWATTVLFGQVPKDKQLVLSVMAGAALVWPVLLVGILVPSFATFLLAFVTIPDWAEPYVRPVLIAAAVALPLGIGALTTRLPTMRREARGRSLARTLLSGFPTAIALFVVLVWMMVVAPIGRIRAATKRWESAHVALAIKPNGYPTVVRDLSRALRAADIEVVTRRAPWPYEVPGRVLAVFGGPGVAELVPRQLTMFSGRGLEIVIHPVDLAMQGRKRVVAKARAALVRELTFTEAYQTWSRGAQLIEDELALAARGRADLDAVARKLEVADLDFEEWEILYRLLLQVRLRASPLETDALAPELEPAPGLGLRLAGVLGAVRALWPARRKQPPAQGGKPKAA